MISGFRLSHFSIPFGLNMCWICLVFPCRNRFNPLIGSQRNMGYDSPVKYISDKITRTVTGIGTKCLNVFGHGLCFKVIYHLKGTFGLCCPCRLRALSLKDYSAFCVDQIMAHKREKSPFALRFAV